MFFEQTCVVYLIVSLRWVEVKTRRCISRPRSWCFEQTCVVYLIAVRRGLRLEDVSRRKKMYFEQTCGFFLNCKGLRWVEG